MKKINPLNSKHDNSNFMCLIDSLNHGYWERNEFLNFGMQMFRPKLNNNEYFSVTGKL